MLKINKEETAANISRMIKEKGYTKSAAAEAIGCNYCAVLSWTRARSMPRHIEVALNLARALDCNIEDYVSAYEEE